MARPAQTGSHRTYGPRRTSFFGCLPETALPNPKRKFLYKNEQVRQLATLVESDFDSSVHFELLLVDVGDTIPAEDTTKALRGLMKAGVEITFLHRLEVPQLASLIDQFLDASFFLTLGDDEEFNDLLGTLEDCYQFAERPFPIVAADGTIEILAVASLNDKPAVITAIQHAFSATCQVPDRCNALLTAVDEVLVNAIRHGSQPEQPSASVFGLEANSPRSKVQISYGAKLGNFYVSIRDCGGRLNRAELTRSLQVTTLRQAKDLVSMKPGSAGVGLLMTAASIDRLDVFLHQGIETVFRLVQSMKTNHRPMASEICSVTVQSRGVQK